MTVEETTAAEEAVRKPQVFTRRQIVLTMAGVMLAMFLSSLDQTIVGTAMPRIITDLGGFAHYTWVTTAYMITSTITVPITGKLADIYGRKGLFILGIAIFILGSLFSGLSQSMLQIIMARGFQGIGAGIMAASTLIVTADMFPPAERPKYTGIVMGVFGISSVVGPTLGGYITDNLSWHWIFFINIPLGVITIVLFALYFPRMTLDNLKHKIDYAGIAAMIMAVSPLMLALSWGGVEYAWVSPQIIAMLVMAVVMASAFVVIETRSKEPLIPLGIFRNRIVAVSMLVSFTSSCVLFGAIVFIPLFFQGVLGSSATKSGNLLMPMMLGMIGGSLISGQLLSRLGRYRILGSTGLIICVLGLFLLSRMSPEVSYGRVVVNIAVLGVGMGFIMPIYNVAIQNAVPYRVLGAATAASAFFRSIGGVLGLSVFGSLMNSRFASEFLSGIPAAVKSAVPAETLNSLAGDPRALLNAGAQAQLKSTFDQMGAAGAGLFDQVLETLKHALSSAVTEVFFIGLFVVLFAWAVNWFLKEIPLRKHRG